MSVIMFKGLLSYQWVVLIYQKTSPDHVFSNSCCGRPWPAAYINFNQYIHQIQVLTKPLCLAQAIFY